METHLQAVENQCGKTQEGSVATFRLTVSHDSVSYTHLDVYKRQVQK